MPTLLKRADRNRPSAGCAHAPVPIPRFSDSSGDKDIDQIKTDCRNNEKIHAGDVERVVTQKGAPSLVRRSISLDHVVRDARLSNLETELEQLAMDARRFPQRIFRAHPPDQRPQIRGDLRSASKRAGFPTPISTKAGPMPTQRVPGRIIVMTLRTDGKPSIELDQEQAIPIREMDATAHPPLQHNQLMSQRGVLCHKSAPRLERETNRVRKKQSSAIIAAHVRRFGRMPVKAPNAPLQYDWSASHGSSRRG
jgi:hypothetical protein